MSKQLQSHGLTFKAIGSTDADCGYDQYWLVTDDECEPIDELRLGDAFSELFYRRTDVPGGMYCTHCHDFPDPIYEDRCVLEVQVRYDI